MIRFIHFGFQGPSKSLASKLRSNERLFFRQRNRPCSFDTNKQTRQKGTCKLVVDADCFLKLLSVSTFGKIISSQYTISKTWKPSIVSFGLTFTSQKTTTMTFAFNTPSAVRKITTPTLLTMLPCSIQEMWLWHCDFVQIGCHGDQKRMGFQWDPQYPKLPKEMTLAFKHPKSP